jgi:hypothetical protein
MPVHDWTRVDAGVFHDFHNVWIGELRNALNSGLLPPEFYAMSEQLAGKYISDVLTLATSRVPRSVPISGGVAVAEVPPKVRRKLALSSAARTRRKTVHDPALVGMVNGSSQGLDECGGCAGRLRRTGQLGIETTAFRYFVNHPFVVESFLKKSKSSRATFCWPAGDGCVPSLPKSLSS